jgi:hypothetical protein
MVKQAVMVVNITESVLKVLWVWGTVDLLDILLANSNMAMMGT